MGKVIISLRKGEIRDMAWYGQVEEGEADFALVGVKVYPTVYI
jgi:hypothetical protein